MSTPATPLKDTKFGKKSAGPVEWLDERLGLAGVVRKNIRKVFPDHWSFLLGEIALWSFVVLLITGTFLTFWFQPSMTEVTYNGAYEPMRGLEMSAAYASTLDISFDIRGGLLMRQIHHWSAALFMAAIVAHMLRVFFTGAYRKPREINWLIGVGLFAVGMIEGFAGYSLPDDLLSGTGLRFVDGLIRSIPIVGTYLEFFVFGGEFPGELIIPRLYMAHIFLIPGLLLGLIAAHMLLLVYHKHTQWPGPGRTEKNVVGYPMLPVYAAKAGGFFFVVFGFTTLMASLIQINPIWTYGPYNPSEVTAGSQPDWYMGWVEGAVRIMPNWEFTIGPQTFSLNVFLPAVCLMGVLFTLLAIWPFFEAWVTGDKREHHLLQRPRNAPTRTALGVAAMTCYGFFWIAGGNDIIALKFHLDIFTITWIARIGVFVGPVVAFIVTRRLCISLQRRDNDMVLHGYETGIIVRSAEGTYEEAHAPLSTEEAFALTAHNRVLELTTAEEEDANGVRNPRSRKERLRAWAQRFFYAHDVDKPTKEEVDAAAHHFDDDIFPPHEFPEDFSGVSETGVPKQH